MEKCCNLLLSDNAKPSLRLCADTPGPPATLLPFSPQRFFSVLLRCINSNSPNLDSLHIWDWVLMNAKLSSFQLRKQKTQALSTPHPPTPKVYPTFRLQILSGNLEDCHVSNISIKPDRKIIPVPSRKDLTIAHKMHFPTLAQEKQKMI